MHDVARAPATRGAASIQRVGLRVRPARDLGLHGCLAPQRGGCLLVRLQPRARRHLLRRRAPRRVRAQHRAHQVLRRGHVGATVTSAGAGRGQGGGQGHRPCASGETSAHLGRRRFGTQSSSTGVSSKGGYPTSKMCSTTPRLHTSHPSPYCCPRITSAPRGGGGCTYDSTRTAVSAPASGKGQQARIDARPMPPCPAAGVAGTHLGQRIPRCRTGPALAPLNGPARPRWSPRGSYSPWRTQSLRQPSLSANAGAASRRWDTHQ